MIGTTINHFKIERELGKGGMGVVNLASRTGLVSAVRVVDGKTSPHAELPFRDPDPRMVEVNRDATASLYSKREPVRDLWMLRAGDEQQ